MRHMSHSVNSILDGRYITWWRLGSIDVVLIANYDARTTEISDSLLPCEALTSGEHRLSDPGAFLGACAHLSRQLVNRRHRNGTSLLCGARVEFLVETVLSALK
ncbi:hypothetical protein PENTCL1PPCAC_18766, partial [Pristionchus entomophagus]